MTFFIYTNQCYYLPIDLLPFALSNMKWKKVVTHAKLKTCESKIPMFLKLISNT